jgi:hypothetical protein
LTDPTELAFRGELARAEQLLAGDGEYEQWLSAYLDAARGRFISALATTRRLTLAHDPSVRAAANRTAASVLRQTARHRDARVHDEQALREARTEAERAHALIGLAADAVGIGAHGGCAALLRRAAATAPADDWRVLVRLEWVRTEFALLTDNPTSAQWFASAAVRKARAAGARRHVAKSMLFLGVSQRVAGDPSALQFLREAARIANELGAAPIARAARELLGRDFSVRSVG